MNKSPEGTMYVSTCGSLSEAIRKELETVFANAKANGQSVTLAFDNDSSGRKMHKVVSELAGVHQVVCKDATSAKGKDWNQDLVDRLGNQHMLKRLQKELVRSGQEYELRKQRERRPTVMGLELSFD